jgi:hypothetical protein
MALSGAVGILLAALVYFLAKRANGALSMVIPVREAEIVIFAVLLMISLLEMPVMIVGLRQLRAASVSRVLAYAANTFFVAFAAVYAALQVLFFGESNYSDLLAGLSVLRWLGGLWIL